MFCHCASSLFFFFSSRRRHTRCSRDWSSDVCSSDLVFPVFHRFRGGKGVATAAAALFGFDWRLGLATLAAWVVLTAAFRYVSLASMAAALFACGFAWFIGL